MQLTGLKYGKLLMDVVDFPVAKMLTEDATKEEIEGMLKESGKVVIKPSAVKELEAVPKKHRVKVAQRIASLAEDPRPPDCKKLSGQERYRVRQGVYRIVYSIEDVIRIVRVVKVAHRKEAYR